MRRPLWPDGAPLDLLGADTLLGRVAEPEDVAKVYVGLMEQVYVTGNMAIVDGGSILT